MNPLDIQNQQRRLFSGQAKGYDPYQNLKTGYYNPGYLDMMGMGMKRMDMTLEEQRRMDREMILRMEENVKSAGTSVLGTGASIVGGIIGGTIGGLTGNPYASFIGGEIGSSIANNVFGGFERKNELSKAIRREFQGKYGEGILGTGSLNEGGILSGNKKLDQLSTGFEDMAKEDDNFTSKDLVEMAARFKNSGLLQNSSSTKDFFKTFKKMKENIKDVMENMGTSLKEAQDMMVGLDRQGFNKTSNTLVTMGKAANTYAEQTGQSKQATAQTFLSAKQQGAMAGFNSDSFASFLTAQNKNFLVGKQNKIFEDGAVFRQSQILGKDPSALGSALAGIVAKKTSGLDQGLTLLGGKGGYEVGVERFLDGEFKIEEVRDTYRDFIADAPSEEKVRELEYGVLEARKSKRYMNLNARVSKRLINGGRDVFFGGGEMSDMALMGAQMGNSGLNSEQLKIAQQSFFGNSKIKEKPIIYKSNKAIGFFDYRLSDFIDENQDGSMKSKDVDGLLNWGSDISDLVDSLEGVDAKKRRKLISKFDEDHESNVEKSLGKKESSWVRDTGRLFTDALSSAGGRDRLYSNIVTEERMDGLLKIMGDGKIEGKDEIARASEILEESRVKTPKQKGMISRAYDGIGDTYNSFMYPEDGGTKFGTMAGDAFSRILDVKMEQMRQDR